MLAGRIEIHEVPLGSAAGDSSDLHAGDIARVGDGDIQEPLQWEENRIPIAEEAHLGALNSEVKSLRRPIDQPDVGNRLQLLKEILLVKEVKQEEIQVHGL